MTTQEAAAKWREKRQLICALEHGSSMIYYDGVTSAPSGTAANRGQTLGILSALIYEASAGSETEELLSLLDSRREELDAVTARSVELALREQRRLKKLPPEEYVAYQKLVNEASDLWHRAKETDDWALFEPCLARVVEMKRRFCRYIDPDKAAYDVLLDRYERGLTMERCDEFFARLREKIVPLVRAVGERKPPEDAWLHRTVTDGQQRQAAEAVMALMGIDRTHCGLATTEHPFTIEFSRYDVRITTHYKPEDLASSLFSVIHEGGHALYELHTGEELAYTGLGTGVSMGIHESQSRFYENLLGRSLPFCRALWPALCRIFPEVTAGRTPEEFHRCVNIARPSLIRTEADELTYALHIMVRYELERALFDGTLEVPELPERWRELYREYLGIAPETDRDGVLQDSHWSGGDFGYFPSYALGSAYGAQLLAKMRENVDVDGCLERGDLAPVNAWLEERIWRHGCLYEPGELLERALGEPFDPGYFTEYLEKKFTALYGL